MLSKKVKEIMSTDLITVGEDEPLTNFENKFKSRRIHHILVENIQGELVGIISSEDAAKSKSWLVKDKVKAFHLMTEYPITIHEDTQLKEVRSHFLINRYRALPVKNEIGDLVGIVTPYDLIEDLNS